MRYPETSSKNLCHPLPEGKKKGMETSKSWKHKGDHRILSSQGFNYCRILVMWQGEIEENGIKSSQNLFV